MIIEVEVTKQDILNFNLFYLEKSKYAKLINRMLRYGISFLIFTIFFSILPIFSILIIASLWIIFYPHCSAIIIKKIVKRRFVEGKVNNFMGCKILTLKNNYIEEIIGTNRTIIKYPMINRIEQDDKNIYIYCTLKTILIPYHSFSDLEQRNEFYNLLLQKAELQGENPINSKSTKKTVYTLLCYGISFSIYALILLWGLKQKEEIFGYAYTSFYFIIPITSFLASLTITISGSFLKWIYPFLFGVLGIVISIIVFPKISWAPDVWVSCTMPAFIGLAIGMFTCTKRKKLSNTNQ